MTTGTPSLSPSHPCRTGFALGCVPPGGYRSECLVPRDTEMEPRQARDRICLWNSQFHGASSLLTPEVHCSKMQPAFLVLPVELRTILSQSGLSQRCLFNRGPGHGTELGVHPMAALPEYSTPTTSLFWHRRGLLVLFFRSITILSTWALSETHGPPFFSCRDPRYPHITQSLCHLLSLSLGKRAFLLGH